MQARYNPRIHVTGRVLMTAGKHVSEGRLLDLTVPGCLIESPLSVNKGDSLQLKLVLTGVKSSFQVRLATVRWTKGFQFGVEFLKMDEKDQNQLERVMAPHRVNQASQKAGARPQFSNPGGPNWHLETYAFPKEPTITGVA